MKKLVITMLCVGGLLLILPFGMGILAEQVIKRNYAGLDIEHYHRGWFSSTATINVRLHSAKLSGAISKYLSPLLQVEYQLASEKNIPFVLDLSILHGPVIFQSNTNFNIRFGLALINSSVDLPWNDHGMRWIKNIVGDKKLVTSASLIHYFGDVSNESKVADVNYADVDNNWQLKWSGLRMISDASNDMKKFAFNSTIAPVFVTDLKGNPIFSSSPVQIDVNMRQGIYTLWFGDLNFRLDNIKLISNSKSIMAISGIKATQHSDFKDEKIATVMKYQVDKLELQDQHYGPTNLVVQVSGLSGRELKSISERVKIMDLESMPEEQLRWVGLQLLPDLIHMINGASLDVAFNTKAPAGDVNMKLAIATTAQEKGIVDPFVLAKSITGQCALTIPKSLLKSILSNEAEVAINAAITKNAKERAELPDYTQATQIAEAAADEHLASLEQDGWLIIKGENYVGNYELKEGKLFSNGKLMFDFLEIFQLPISIETH